MSPYLRSPSAQLLAFPKEKLWRWCPCKIPFCKQEKPPSCTTDWLSRNDMVFLLCLFPYDFQCHRVGYLRLKPHDRLSRKSKYIITWCKTLIWATFQSIRKNSDLVKSRFLPSYFDYTLAFWQAKPQYWLNFLGCHEYYKYFKMSHPLQLNQESETLIH